MLFVLMANPSRTHRFYFFKVSIKFLIQRFSIYWRIIWLGIQVGSRKWTCKLIRFMRIYLYTKIRLLEFGNLKLYVLSSFNSFLNWLAIILLIFKIHVHFFNFVTRDCLKEFQLILDIRIIIKILKILRQISYILHLLFTFLFV